MPTQVQGLGLVDDQGNKSIVVNLSNARQMTNAEYQQLTPAQRNGAIIVTDYPIPEESDEVSVTADGTKTYATLLNELYALVDIDKINNNSYIIVNPNSSTSEKFILNYRDTNSMLFTHNICASSIDRTICITLSSSSERWLDNTGTVTNVSSSVAASGVKITLHYNYYKNQDIHTEYLASNCMMQDGSSVEDTLGGAKIYIEYRRNIVFSDSDSSDWFTPPSAISSKTIYGFTFASLSGGGGYTTKKLGENEFAIKWGSSLNMTIVCNLIWFYN